MHPTDADVEDLALLGRTLVRVMSHKGSQWHKQQAVLIFGEEKTHVLLNYLLTTGAVVPLGEWAPDYYRCGGPTMAK